MKIEDNRLCTEVFIPSRKYPERSKLFLILKNNRYGASSKYTLKEYYIEYIRSLYYEY